MSELQLIGPSTPIPHPMERRRDITLPRGTFSFSQFRLEKQCAACYEARYVLGKPFVSGTRRIQGGAIHGGLNFGRQALMKGESIDVGSVVDAVAQAFDDALAGKNRWGEVKEPVLKMRKADKSWGEIKDATLASARFTVPEVLRAEATHRILAIETEVDMRGVFPFDFRAYADRMLDDLTFDTFGHIGDDKSVEKDMPPDVWTAWQCTTYSLPFWLAGEPIGVGVNQHIGTKTPAVHLWTEPGYSFQPSGDQHLAVYDMIVRSAERVSAGRFEPGPHPYGCDYEHPRYPRFGIVVPEAAVA